MDNKDLLEAIRGIVKEEIEPIKLVQEEHTQILRSLEERTKVTQAEVENIKYDVAELKGSVDRLEENLNFVEIATSKNWTEIAMLKTKKQA